MERKKANLFNGGGSTSTALAAHAKGKKLKKIKKKKGQRIAYQDPPRNEF
jgi:hypothetical protein